MVDIDTHHSAALNINRINSLFRAAQLHYQAMRITKTRRGWHQVFLLAKGFTVSAAERVAMELILGDDPFRGAMNFARARNIKGMPKYWRQRWNILYDHKIS